MTVLYENHQRAKRARMSLFGAIFWSVGCLYLAYALHSSGTREALVVVTIAIGFLPLVLLHFYGNSYVVRLARDGDELFITTLGLTGNRDLRVPVGAVTEIVRAEASGLTMRVASRRMPFLVDLQAEHIDVDAINALASVARGKASDNA